MANLFERKETYKPHEILDFLPDPAELPKGFKLKRIKKEYDGDMMKMGSDRYYTFRESLECVFCGITGVVMAKERHVDKKGKPLQGGGYHFNLYAINEKGEEVLMTKDHIIPKARGGKDVLSNYQTACACCNEEKRATKDEVYREKIRQRKESVLSN